jgi:hypothetical protein
MPMKNVKSERTLLTFELMSAKADNANEKCEKNEVFHVRGMNCESELD